MGLFTNAEREKIDSIARKSKTVSSPKKSNKSIASINAELQESSEAVKDYFKDSEAILIKDKYALSEYVDAAIAAGYVGIDTETTGLDRSKDVVVGMSLYYPGGVECYIPFKHRVPVFEDPYRDQMSYEDAAEQLERFVDNKTKLIFANANFDLYMIWKDLHVDLCPVCYYDVILAWRVIKEDEPRNGLKQLYTKYPMRGKGDPKKFSDFFSPELFPYSKPEIAALYAANDAKITYELFKWQLPLVVPSHEACQKRNLEHISNLLWNLEFPLISVIQDIERNGMYIDVDTAKALQAKYHAIYDAEMDALRESVDNILHETPIPSNVRSKLPFNSGKDFNPRSTKHVQAIIYDILGMENLDGKRGTSVEILKEFNLPITKQILSVRSLSTNISTFVDKLPEAVSSDGKIHADFKQIGAATGRLSSSEPNLMNIPSKLKDIRHMFRADPVTIETKELSLDDSVACIELMEWDQVRDESGRWKSPVDIKVGDKIKLTDSEDVFAQVIHSSSDAPEYRFDIKVI